MSDGEFARHSGRAQTVESGCGGLGRVEQGRLADPGWTRETQARPVAGPGIVEHGGDGRHFGLPPDEHGFGVYASPVFLSETLTGPRILPSFRGLRSGWHA